MTKGFGVTANRLGDGAVVYLTSDRSWSPSSRDLVLRDAAESEAAVAWAKTQERVVCGPYAFELSIESDGSWKTSARERLRAAGAAAVRERLGVGEAG